MGNSSLVFRGVINLLPLMKVKKFAYEKINFCNGIPPPVSVG